MGSDTLAAVNASKKKSCFKLILFQFALNGFAVVTGHNKSIPKLSLGNYTKNAQNIKYCHA
jgi:hypothetical protein